MGTMLVTFHAAGQPVGDDNLAVVKLNGAKTERVTTSNASARTTLTATNGASSKKTDGGFATVTAIGANIFVTTGVTAVYPAAANNSPGFPVMSGQSITFALSKNDRVAGIEF